MKRIEVVAAIIIYQDRFLCVRRGESPLDYISKKWEFPGGKIESNESKDQALEREIREELEMIIDNINYFTTVTHTYPDFILTMHAYKCTSDEVTPTLNEHLEYKWLPIDDLSSLDWAAADIPIVNQLVKGESVSNKLN